MNEAIELSKKNNPDIKNCKIEYGQSEKDLKLQIRSKTNSKTLSLERSYTDDLSSTYDEREKDVLKATVSWPFYSGGKKRSKVNKNSNKRNRKRLLLDNAIEN